MSWIVTSSPTLSSRPAAETEGPCSVPSSFNIARAAWFATSTCSGVVPSSGRCVPVPRAAYQAPVSARSSAPSPWVPSSTSTDSPSRWVAFRSERLGDWTIGARSSRLVRQADRGQLRCRVEERRVPSSCRDVENSRPHTPHNTGPCASTDGAIRIRRPQPHVAGRGGSGRGCVPPFLPESAPCSSCSRRFVCRPRPGAAMRIASPR